MSNNLPIAVLQSLVHFLNSCHKHCDAIYMVPFKGIESDILPFTWEHTLAQCQ